MRKRKYQSGGLNLRGTMTNPSAYTPFGKDANTFFQEGWNPVNTSNGKTTYKNSYNNALSGVEIPGDKRRGYVGLIGDAGGHFDLAIENADGVPQNYIYKGVTAQDAQNYFNSNNSPIGLRTKSIIDGTNIDKTQADGSYASLYRKGGPTPAKAHEMLKDGTAHGKKLTKKQKRYFGFIYGSSKKQMGGPNYNFPQFLSHDQPNQVDSMIYKRNFLDMVKGDPTALRNFKLKQFNPTLPLGLPDNTDIDISNTRQNAYQDAANQQANYWNVPQPQLHDYIKKIRVLNEKQAGGLINPFLENVDDPLFKKGGWIKNAVNKDHKGFCTPMTKSTCTPRRKAFAKRAKAHFK